MSDLEEKKTNRYISIFIRNTEKNRKLKLKIKEDCEKLTEIEGRIFTEMELISNIIEQYYNKKGNF